MVLELLKDYEFQIVLANVCEKYKWYHQVYGWYMQGYISAQEVKDAVNWIRCRI